MSKVSPEGHRTLVIDNLIRNRHIANLITCYGARSSQIDNLTNALFVECIQNNVRIMAIDIARNHKSLLDRRVRKESYVQSFLYQRLEPPTLLQQNPGPLSFKAKEQPVLVIEL